MDIDHEKFSSYTRSALHYLYDPDQLRRSPLAEIFGISERVDAPAALQKILLDAIEALKPGDEEPDQSRAWVFYELLFFRYVRGYERDAVANHLGISDRQLSREQRSAIDVLSLRLWDTYQVQANSPGGSPQPATAGAQPATEPVDGSWVKDLPAEKAAAWKPAIQSVINLLHPLFQQQAVTLQYEPDERLPDLIIPHLAVRHALLNILGLLAPAAAMGTLTITPSIQAHELRIQIEAQPAPGAALAFDGTEPGMTVAVQLLERAGGAITQAQSGQGRQIILRLPASEQIQVLVIEDNPDIIQLFQRYAQGTRYSVIGIQEPREAIQAVEMLHPRIIVMDIMMPEMDGWDLLTRLREETTGDPPAIIICSILPQAGLAHALSADGFLQKPVLPEDFLRMLDQQEI